MSTPTPVKVTLRVLGGLVSAALVLAGATSVATTLAERSGARTVTLPADGVTAVDVRVGVGSVRLERAPAGATGTARDVVQVELSTRGSWRLPTATAERSGDTIGVTGSCSRPRWGGCRVDVVVRVPAGTDPAAHVDLDVGDVRVVGAWSALEVLLDAGEITGTDLEVPRAVARADVGDVDLRWASVPDDVQAAVDVGEVRVTVPSDGTAYDVRAGTDIGDRVVRVPLDTASRHRVDVSAAVGGVRVVTDAD